MSGEWMLVAPVYTAGIERDSIYLPSGTWVDYWDGTVYEGDQTINDYLALLTKCPVFIKAGAIIPMYPEMLFDNEYPKDPVTFDVYPDGITSFELYEDDGLTREHREGAFSKTLVTCNGPGFGEPGIVSITVGESIGEYDGKPEDRAYRFEVHMHFHPDAVLLDDMDLEEYVSLEELEQAAEGWFYDPDDKLGIVHVKSQPLPLDTPFEVVIDGVMGRKKTSSNNRLTVVPNPTRGRLTVNTGELDVKGVSLYDSGGNAMNDSIRVSYYGTNAELDISGLPDGMYYLEVRAGETILTEKVTLMR
jgi:hypothetical protein